MDWYACFVVIVISILLDNIVHVVCIWRPLYLYLYIYVYENCLVFANCAICTRTNKHYSLATKTKKKSLKFEIKMNKKKHKKAMMVIIDNVVIFQWQHRCLDDHMWIRTPTKIQIRPYVNLRAKSMPVISPLKQLLVSMQQQQQQNAEYHSRIRYNCMYMSICFV